MRIILLSIFSLLSICGFSQVDKNLIPLPKYETDWSSQVIISDHLGRAFRPAYVDISGNPFYFDYWINATARNDSGRIKGLAKIKIDIFNQEIDCMGVNKDSLIIKDGFFTEFTLHDSLRSGKNYLFRCGYPSIDKNNKFTFYRVLADGKLQLLEASRKSVAQSKNDMTGEISKEFVRYDDYYIYQNGDLIKWKKDKDFLLGIMNDRQKKVEAYLHDKNVNFKNPESEVGLFNAYNSD